jgi:predicted kinase
MDQPELTAIAVIGIGLPASGKSTWLKAFATNTSAEYISSDDVRAQLNGDAASQCRPREVWQTVYQRIEATLKAGGNLVVDATNAKQSDRQRLVSFCRPLAKEVIGVWFVTPYAVCAVRNQRRERFVRRADMEIMCRSLQAAPPQESEGFDQLLRIDTSVQP